MSQNGPISSFIEKHYLHFNAAALVDAAKGYKKHVADGKKMMVTLAGAMSTGELGISFAEMIRQNKVHIISCTGANLEEDIMNLVAHSHYKRIPNYRDLTPEQEWDLSTKSPESCHRYLYSGRRSISKIAEASLSKYGKMLKTKANASFHMSLCSDC